MITEFTKKLTAPGASCILHVWIDESTGLVAASPLPVLTDPIGDGADAAVTLLNRYNGLPGLTGFKPSGATAYFQSTQIGFNQMITRPKAAAALTPDQQMIRDGWVKA